MFEWRGGKRCNRLQRSQEILSIIFPPAQNSNKKYAEWSTCHMTHSYKTHKWFLSHEHFVVMILNNRRDAAHKLRDFGKLMFKFTQFKTQIVVFLHRTIQRFYRVHKVTFILKHNVQEYHVILTRWIKRTEKAVRHSQWKRKTCCYVQRNWWLDGVALRWVDISCFKRKTLIYIQQPRNYCHTLLWPE